MKHSKYIVSTLLTVTLLTPGVVPSGSSEAQAHAETPAPVATASLPAAASSAAKVDLLVLQLPKWEAKTDGQGMYDKQAPTANGLVYYSVGGTLTAADLSTGKVKWTYPHGGNPQVVTNNSVFFITYSGYLVKANAKTGKTLWKVKVAATPIEIGAFAELHNNVLYFRNESGGIAAFDPVSGKKKWENKALEMYVGSIDGQYGGVLIASSTVDNIRTQFFGLDPATGKRLWRTAGLYSYIGYREGQLLLRQMPDVTGEFDPGATKGYQVTLAHVDVKTGKITKRNNYSPLDNVSKLGAAHNTLQNDLLYTADYLTGNDQITLSRIQLGQNATATAASYAEYGNWLAGPVNGMAFFQKGAQLTGLQLSNNRVTQYSDLESPVTHLQLIGKGIYAGLENGQFHILNAATGKTLTKVDTVASFYGTVFVQDGTVLIQTEKKLFAVALPKELN